MGAVQMYLISLCSSKMKRLLKKYISQINFDLQIEIDESSAPFIIRLNDDDLGFFFVESLQQQCPHTDKQLGSFNELTFFGSDVFHGATKTYETLLDLFPCQGRTCIAEDVCDDIQKVIEWTNTLSPELTDFTVEIQDNVTEDHYSYVIKSLEQLHSVNIHLNSKQYFSTVDIDMKGKRFLVYHAEWVTLDHLLKFDGVVMCFGSSLGVKMTDKEMNTFLKTYIQNETSGNLEYMSLAVDRHMDKNAVLDGLVWSEVEEEDVRMIGKYGVLHDETNKNGLRIVMKNREICYVRVINCKDGRGVLLIFNWKDEVFKPFPLLRLPYVALQHVIKSMKLMGAFNLSLCSPTLRHFVKFFFKSGTIKLLIDITGYIVFRLKASNESLCLFEICKHPEILERCMKMKIGNASRIPLDYHDSRVLRTFWRDLIKGATEVYTQISELFNIHFENLIVKKNDTIDYGSVVDWITGINVPIKDVHFGRGTVDDTLYSQIINSKNFQKCIIHQTPSENFKSPEFRFTDAHVNWEVYNAHWITLENLSDIGSSCLILKNLRLTNQEVNLFLRTLITGKFPNLEMIEIRLNRRDISQTAIMDGITDLENAEVNRDVRPFHRYGWRLNVENSVDVRMATGETCSFLFHNDENGLLLGITVVIPNSNLF
ncbi:hypothetical protein CAEBREN_01682 [Caenorhabditis brenneri]|uniref:F-box domain-containing protein n=1 Tax=Caenorhabditis brenneri TaxID=135651 RepID=G0NVR4_CAEBE|nr:hypothetical protein CAEBREN_01682 [Caenorhabditis brenneri]